MKRRDFLKLIGITPIVPSVLAAMPKKELTVAAAREFVKKTIPEGGRTINMPIEFTIKDIPKCKYKWVQIYCRYDFDSSTNSYTATGWQRKYVE